jgi:Na+/H+ antiporter NhaD/arsenite permease-like protein
MSFKAFQFKRRLAALAEKEPFFLVILLLTLALLPFSRPHFSAVHWDVIATLFSLMLTCLAFEQCRFLSSLSGAAAGAFSSRRMLGFALIAATGVLAMFVTNDVALFTVVPLTLLLAQASGKDPALLIILETISANVFSPLTPFGNPQNLYLYSFYKIPPAVFFQTMLPFCLMGGAILFALHFALSGGGPAAGRSSPFEIDDARLFAGASAAFALNVLSVLRILDFRIALAATLLIFIAAAPRLFLRVDYFLLLTFVLFFLFSDSITGIPWIRLFFHRALHTQTAVLLGSAALSQVISNVPAAVVISGFTGRYRELLYGVSAGGLGTPVASLASIISYKLYIRRYPNGKYMRKFLILNFSALLLLLAGLLLLGRLAPGI